MATQEEILKILLQVQGSDEVRKLKDEQEKLEDEIKRVTSSMKGMDAATMAANPGLKLALDQYKSNTVRLDELDKQLGRTRNGMAGLGQSFLQSGRIVQDFSQGGIGGILNNIEGATQALGLGPGLAGVLTMVGVAAFIAKPYIEDFIKSLKFDDVTKFTGSIETMKERIKELEDKKIKLSVDDAELKRLTKEVEDLTAATKFANQLLTKQTKAESASGRAVEDALVETPGADKAIEQARRDAINKGIAESKTVAETRAKIAAREQEVTKQQAIINDPKASPVDHLSAPFKLAAAKKELEKGP